MDEVDKIIIQSFKEIGCHLEDDVVSLRQLTSELVVEAAVRCLNIIQPGLSLSPQLPPSMSARYKVGTAIAEACTELGYTGEIGYQTFLYSSEADVRRVFIFLVEKLPKESDKSSSQQEDASSSLRQSFSEALRRQVSNPWKPPSSSSLHSRHSFVSVPLETGISLPGQKRDCTPQEWREFCVHKLPFLHKQVTQGCQLLPSIISHHTASCLGLSISATPPETPAPTTLPPPPINSWTYIASTLLYTKEPNKKRDTRVEKEEEKEAEAVTDQREEIEQEAIEQLRERMEQLELDIKTVTTKLTQVVAEKQKQECVYQEKQRECELRQKTLNLLPDSGANINKLQELIDQQAKTLLRLGAQWEQRRAGLVSRYREARQCQTNKATESARQLETARQTRERLREMKEELATKEALQARLQEEHDKLSKTVSRTAYTRRILEIIGNIKKQKEDIDKIVEDTKQLQRDINIVSDRVDRSFTYADEIVFRDCAKENSSRKIYKLLIQLHSDCEQVVAMIEETGAISDRVDRSFTYADEIVFR
ncbi:coiled-coil domain-containing protein 22-like, partial [Homalodisca vitripennis]|uniref:coiled-coil domain-containing protein 22-like n=1 Tax=Homalodisca vitripennis TaxID=197043 RepID=UPI001EE9BD78